MTMIIKFLQDFFIVTKVNKLKVRIYEINIRF